MVQKKGKRALVTALSILVVLLAVIGGIAIMKAVAPNSKDPYAQQSSADDTTSKPDQETPAANTTPEPDTSPDSGENNTTIDPATLSTIDVTPLGIKVSYTKGVGGFEYEVLRRPNGTRYVEFRSSELVGTKCTDDMGAFVSILENPASNETSTLAKTTTVGGTLYGLSLAASTCTSNIELLKKYQAAFSDPFTLLVKL